MDIIKSENGTGLQAIPFNDGHETHAFFVGDVDTEIRAVPVDGDRILVVHGFEESARDFVYSQQLEDLFDMFDSLLIAAQ